MFSAWDVNSWITSVGVVLFLGCYITGFGWLVTRVITRIWGEEAEIAASPRMTQATSETLIRKAA